jgi:hypothetical protein
MPACLHHAFDYNLSSWRIFFNIANFYKSFTNNTIFKLILDLGHRPICRTRLEILASAGRETGLSTGSLRADTAHRMRQTRKARNQPHHPREGGVAAGLRDYANVAPGQHEVLTDTLLSQQ